MTIKPPLFKRLIATSLRPIDDLAAAMSWRGLRRFISDVLETRDVNDLILNVGAGGRTARVIEPLRILKGFRLVSLDIDAARGPDVVADVISYAPSVQYEVIVMIEVLEHVLDPIAAIRNVHRILKPGGILALSTPFLFPIHDRPMDYFRFTRYGLRHLCSEFETVTIKARDSWGETLCVLLARLLRERSLGAKICGPFAVVGAAFLYPFGMLASRLIRSDAYTIGYTVVARKRAD